MELRLEKCTIRDWRIEDAESLARHANNRNVSIHLRDRFPFPYTPADAQRYLQRVTGEEPRSGFCIEVDGAAVGGIGFELGQDIYRHSAEIGYWLGEEFWNRGMMTAIVRAFSDWLFVSFPLHRIAANVFANNPASARVLEKAGFTFEARLRSYVMKEGVIVDSLVYARIRDAT